MAKDPAFLFYPGDWLGGTMGMTFEQQGAYLHLLLYQFNNYHFTEAQAKQVLSTCFSNVWDMIKTKFEKEGDNDEFLFNRKLRLEIERRKSFSESRRSNASGGKKEKQISEAYAEHMETETETVNEDIKEKKKRTVFVPPTLEEVTAYCRERKNTIDPQNFMDYQITRNWILKGGQKMKDWQSAIRTWERNSFSETPVVKPFKQVSPYVFCERCGGEVRREDFLEERGMKFCIKCPERRNRIPMGKVGELVSGLLKTIPGGTMR